MFKRYSDEFKDQIVELHNSGVRQCDLMQQFKLPKCTIRAWRKQYAESGAFCKAAAQSPEARELAKVKKELAQAQKELNILKHAALILGTKKC
jgi:transposase